MSLTSESVEWTRVADQHPPPHTKYEVYRAELGTMVCTPCYGMHMPWWVPLVIDIYSPGSLTLQMLDSDEWRPWNPERRP